MELPIVSESMCHSCNGACCRDILCPPSDPNEAGIWPWLYGLPASLKPEVQVAHDAYVSGKTGPCIWLNEDGLCKHYELRPPVCRVFQPGGRNCRQKRDEHGVPIADYR